MRVLGAGADDAGGDQGSLSLAGAPIEAGGFVDGAGDGRVATSIGRAGAVPGKLDVPAGRYWPGAEVKSVNGDVIDTWASLLKFPGKQSTEKKLSRRTLSSSGFIIMLGVNKSYQKLDHHNVFFSKDYKEEFNEIFKKKVPPSDPTIQ